MHIELSFPGRDKVSFDMGYDPQCVADVTTKSLLERDQACEPECMHVMSRVLREGDLVIDAGANIGFFTLFMSRLVGETGQVLAFEPTIGTISKLAENIEMNRIGNVGLDRRPLWSTDEEVTLHLCRDSGLNSLRPHEESVGNVKLQAQTLDRHCTTPRLIKLDVEGAEEHVLRGAVLTLERGVPFVLCEMNLAALTRFGCNQHSLRTFMDGLGYQMFLPSPEGGIPILIPAGTEIVSERPNLNMLFSTVRDVELAWPKVYVS